MPTQQTAPVPGITGSLADGSVVDVELSADADGIQEEIRLVSDDTRPRQLRLRLGLVTDGVTMSAVKDPRLVPESS